MGWVLGSSGAPGAANSSAVIPVMIRRADMPGRRRPLAVWRSFIAMADVRHGSSHPVAYQLLQVRRSSAVPGLSGALGCRFLFRLRGARVLQVSQDRGEQLALALQLG